MDIDRVFKVPSLPTGKKRRLEPSGEDILKKFRTEEYGSQQNKFKATVEDEHESMDGDDQENASYAPGNDPDYFAEEDEDGRFFGGGLTSEQKEILNIFDHAPNSAAQGTDRVTLPSIRRSLLQFERAVNRNQDQRSKYPDDPSKFIDSEADLDSALKALLPLAQTPSLAYPEIMKSGALQLIIGLLSHENIDVVIDAIELINELTDDDSIQEEEEEDGVSSMEHIKALLKELVNHGVLELLAGNLSRLNEEEESDRQGVFLLLGIFENAVGLDPNLSRHIAKKTPSFDWLIGRLSAKEHDPNRGYAAELLSILLQTDSEARMWFGKDGRLEKLLLVVSQYRKRDPSDSDEFEYLDNLFDCLSSCLLEADNKALFSQSEGVDLMILMLKENTEGRFRALKALDYALSGPSGALNCKTLVEAGGLKPVFSIFTGTGKFAAKAKHLASEASSHCIGILSSLLTFLPRDSVEQIRLLAKFVEKDYAAVDKVLELREAAVKRLAGTNRSIESQKQELARTGKSAEQDLEDVWYLERLEGGLYQLQSGDYILGWVSAEDDGIRAHVETMLARVSQSFKDVLEVLASQLESMEEDSSATHAEAESQKEALRGLVQHLSASS